MGKKECYLVFEDRSVILKKNAEYVYVIKVDEDSNEYTYIEGLSEEDMDKLEKITRKQYENEMDNIGDDRIYENKTYDFLTQHDIDISCIYIGSDESWALKKDHGVRDDRMFISEWKDFPFNRMTDAGEAVLNDAEDANGDVFHYRGCNFDIDNGEEQMLTEIQAEKLRKELKEDWMNRD